MYLQSVITMEALTAAIKKNDRVFFYAGAGNAFKPGAHLQVLLSVSYSARVAVVFHVAVLELLEAQFQLQQVHAFPSDDVSLFALMSDLVVHTALLLCGLQGGSDDVSEKDLGQVMDGLLPSKKPNKKKKGKGKGKKAGGARRRVRIFVADWDWVCLQLAARARVSLKARTMTTGKTRRRMPRCVQLPAQSRSQCAMLTG